MSRTTQNNNNGANLGFQETLWAAAHALRGHMHASHYKHVVLGLIFLKYISDPFQERQPPLVITEIALMSPGRLHWSPANQAQTSTVRAAEL